MKADTYKHLYGDEYPAAVVVDGIRLPLRDERRFIRDYHSDQHKRGHVVCRFGDGSASITASELQREWHAWTCRQRLDFCQFCAGLNEQSDFRDMLRFVIQHSSPAEWCGVALSVASYLPRDEAFDFLFRALRSVEIGRSANICQAIAVTRHPEAESAVCQHLESIWEHRGLWDADVLFNYVAFDAATCIRTLIELGAPPSNFDARVRQLAEHPCAGNHDSCRDFLSDHYGWLT